MHRYISNILWSAYKAIVFKLHKLLDEKLIGNISWDMKFFS